MRPLLRWFYLASCGLLAVACGSNGTSDRSATGGASGAGGNGGVACSGDIDVCVPSCGPDAPTEVVVPCQEVPALFCDGPSVALSSCSSTACPQVTALCCNETTGNLRPPICLPDGTRDACGPGTHATDTRTCIPAGVDVSSCHGLTGTPCAVAGQQCWDGGRFPQCHCEAGDAGLGWTCVTYI